MTFIQSRLNRQYVLYALVVSVLVVIVLSFIDLHPLYQIALPATHLRRYSGLVTAIQVFDLTHVYDAIISAQHRVI